MFEDLFGTTNFIGWASLVAQTVKNLPTVQETRVQSLGQEYPVEKKMATHSSILAWRIPCTEEPGRLQSTGSQRVRHDWATKQQQFYRINQTGKLTKKKKKNLLWELVDCLSLWNSVLCSWSFLLWGLLEIIIYILWISMYLTPVAEVVLYIYLNSLVDIVSEVRKLG